MKRDNNEKDQGERYDAYTVVIKHLEIIQNYCNANYIRQLSLDERYMLTNKIDVVLECLKFLKKCLIVPSFYESCGNVFEDRGVENPAEEKVKAMEALHIFRSVRNGEDGK